jgi:hypothetical protein
MSAGPHPAPPKRAKCDAMRRNAMRPACASSRPNGFAFASPSPPAARSGANPKHAPRTTARVRRSACTLSAEPGQAEPSRAELSRAEPSRAEPSRAGPSRAGLFAPGQAGLFAPGRAGLFAPGCSTDRSALVRIRIPAVVCCTAAAALVSTISQVHRAAVVARRAPADADQ